MASTINVAAYSALVVLGTAGIVVPIVSRLGFSPVLGYLGAGALLGPLGLGSLIHSFPVLYWFTVGDAKDVAGIAYSVSLISAPNEKAPHGDGAFVDHSRLMSGEL